MTVMAFISDSEHAMYLLMLACSNSITWVKAMFLVAVLPKNFEANQRDYAGYDEIQKLRFL